MASSSQRGVEQQRRGERIERVKQPRGERGTAHVQRLFVKVSPATLQISRFLAGTFVNRHCPPSPLHPHSLYSLLVFSSIFIHANVDK